MNETILQSATITANDPQGLAFLIGYLSRNYPDIAGTPTGFTVELTDIPQDRVAVLRQRLNETSKKAGFKFSFSEGGWRKA